MLPHAIADELIAHARAGLPNETCGLVAGRDGVATRFVPTRNADASPYRYSIASEDLLRVVEIEDAGDDLLAIYHSHTRSPAYPSRTDVENAHWPDPVYLIVSLASDPPDVAGFTIRDGAIARVEVAIA